MKLNLSEVRAVTHGALHVSENEKGFFVFDRFTEVQKEFYTHYPDFTMKTAATSAVRLEFFTNSGTFGFTYEVDVATSRRFYHFDVYVDGVLMKHFGKTEISGDGGEFSMTLPEGEHRVALYLPNLAQAMLRDITLDDGATLLPVQKARRMICYGDSITQGYDAYFPSLSYANRIADKLDATMVDQGIGGEKFNPGLLDGAPDLDPDIITVAYGTNDWSSGKPHTAEDAREFFTRLRKIYPRARIFAITPLWRADDDRVTAVGEFSDILRIVREAASAQENTVVLEGSVMMPHIPDVCSDAYLHPNDLGFMFYADALYREMKPYLGDL